MSLVFQTSVHIFSAMIGMLKIALRVKRRVLDL